MNAPAEYRVYDYATPAPLREEAQEILAAHRSTLREGIRRSVYQRIRLLAVVRCGEPTMVRGKQLAEFSHGRAWWYSGGLDQDPRSQKVLFGCEPGLTYCAIDRVLGGAGAVLLPLRQPSDIERHVGNQFLADFFGDLAAVLAVTPLGLKVKGAGPVNEPLPSFLKDPEGPFVRIPVFLESSQGTHELVVCIARDVLEQSAHHQVEKGPVPDRLSQPVAGSRMSLSAVLASCRLSVEEVAGLETGDVILFDELPGGLLDLRLKGQVKFRARLGIHDGRYAVEVLETVGKPNPQQTAAAGPAGKGKSGPGGVTPQQQQQRLRRQQRLQQQQQRRPGGPGPAGAGAGARPQVNDG